MAALEDIKNGAQLRGVVPGQLVEVVSVEWIGDQAINLVYRVRERVSLRQHSIAMIKLGLRSRFADVHGHLMQMATFCALLPRPIG